MSCSRVITTLALGLVAGTLLAQPGEVLPAHVNQLRERMSARQARDLVGQPSLTARQIFSRGHLDQWIYERPEAFRLDVLHAFGQEAQVKAIHRIAKPRPR